MTSKTVTLEIPIWRVTPTEHAGGPCLCDDCWADYLDWAEEQGDRLDPRSPAP